MARPEVPTLQDGYPVPPPGRKRVSLLRKGSVWTATIKLAKPGQSILIPWHNLEGLRAQARKMGVETRFARDGTTVYVNKPLPSREVTAARVWFVNQYQPQQPESMAEKKPHWANDPNYAFEDWQAEVAANETRLGYDEWLESRIEWDKKESRQFTLSFKERTERTVTLDCIGDDPKKAAIAGYDKWLNMSDEEKAKHSEEEDLSRGGNDIEFTVEGLAGEFTFSDSDLLDGEPFQDPNANDDD